MVYISRNDGSLFKSGNIGRLTFEGVLENLGKIPEKIKTKEILDSTVFSYSKKNLVLSDYIKDYDYTKVNKVLARNAAKNFKTISNINVRKYIVNWWH